ncbi:MAG: acyl-CoA dehydrogenase family protein [Rhizomicrobium sp.]
MQNDFGAWQLPEEYRQLKDVVRRFMDTDVKAVDDKLPHDAFTVPKEMLQPLQKKARDLGLWCFRTPAEYGGAGLNLLGQAIVAEESARCRMGSYIWGLGAFGDDPPNVIWMGTPAQIERYAKPTIEGKIKHFVAISEPSGGSDPARSIRCRAARQGNSYIINGDKLWITDAANRDWGILFARTGEQGSRGGISCFVIDGKLEGLTYREVKVIRSYSPYQLHFENVEIPADALIGEEGQGFRVAEKWLIEGRIPYAANTLGTAQAALELAINWVRQREVFGSRLADKQAIQWMIADSEMELRAARLLIYQAAWTGDLGRDFKVESSIAKVTATETAGRVVDRCIQMFGGLGVSQDLPLERWYRELRIKRIGEGPSEVHRMVLARHLLGGRG